MIKESYYRYLYNNSEMLVAFFDSRLNLIDANPAFLRTLNLKLEDVMGKNLSDISPDCKSPDCYAIYENVIKTGEPILMDQLQLHEKFGGIFVRLRAFKIEDGLGYFVKTLPT